MNRQWNLFLCALQMLTRLPVPHLAGFQPDWIVRSARFYPWVGMLVGAIGAGVLLLAGRWWPMPVAAMLAITVCVFATGAFHEDGLADTADGLGGGQTPERRLEIMKDSRIGSYGTLVLVLALGLKFAALGGMAPVAAAAAFVAAHAGGRFAAVIAMTALPYTGDQSVSRFDLLQQAPRAGELLVAATGGLLPLLLLPWPQAGLALLLGSGLALLPALAARRLIGGCTGDVLGATEQCFEVGFLLGAAALVTA